MRLKVLTLVVLVAAIGPASSLAAREAPGVAVVRSAVAARGARPRSIDRVGLRRRGKAARFGYVPASLRPGPIGIGLGSVAGVGFGSVVANGGGYPGGYTNTYYGDCGYGFAGPLPVSCDTYP